MIQKWISILTCALLTFSVSVVEAQLTAPEASAIEESNYPTFPEKDKIFIFCSTAEDADHGVLSVQTEMEGVKTFILEKYNSQTGDYEEISREITENNDQELKNLTAGGYRVTIIGENSTEIYRGWLLYSHITAEAAVSESRCESFQLNGTVNATPMIYNDLATNQEIELMQEINIEWRDEGVTIARMLNPQIFDPPTQNTNYTLYAYNQYGCETTAVVTYHSIVTKAVFTVDPLTGEAPLTVLFTNNSENADRLGYEWFIYDSLDDIKIEAEKNPASYDSIMSRLYLENPSFIFERSGLYKAKLVSKKQSTVDGVEVVCVDTAYMAEYITVDTSFVSVPNVFTPNNDGVNDEFIVKF